MLRRTRAIVAASILAGSALLAAPVVAAPIVAATLPEGQKITTIDTQPGEVFTANPLSAALTPVGPSGVTQLLAVDVDDNGQGYAVMGDPATNVQSRLYKFDAQTGAATAPVDITIAGHGIAFGCRGLDYSGGVLTVGCMYSLNNSLAAVVGTLNPTNGVVAADVVTTQPDPIIALAKNPVDGTIWVFSGLGAIYKTDVAAHTYTAVGVQPNNTFIYGADFDRSGQLYVTYSVFVPATPVPVVVWWLGTMDLVLTPVSTVSGIGQLTNNVRTEALTVWGAAPIGGDDPVAAALPPTGITAAPGIAGGALALVLLGVIGLAVVRRRTA